jgi:hypothetical protein
MQEEAAMRHMRFALALVAGLVLATATPGWAQATSATTTGGASNAARLQSPFLYRESRYIGVTQSVGFVSSALEFICTVADAGLDAPDCLQRQHIQEIMVSLVGARAYPVDPSHPMAGMDANLVYLLGDAGVLRELSAAFDEYVDIVVEECSWALAAYYEAKCSVDYGPEECWDGIGQATLDAKLLSLSKSLERVTALSELALEAAMRIDQGEALERVAADFMSIYAYTGTAAGFWPVGPECSALATLNAGSSIVPGTYIVRNSATDSEDFVQWYTENVPSVLWRFLRDFKQLDQDVSEAIAAALVKP